MTDDLSRARNEVVKAAVAIRQRDLIPQEHFGCRAKKLLGEEDCPFMVFADAVDALVRLAALSSKEPR